MISKPQAFKISQLVSIAILIFSSFLHALNASHDLNIAIGLLLFSFALFISIWPTNQIVIYASIGLFAILFFISAYSAITFQSCGCFPGYPISPYVVATFDFCMLFALITTQSYRENSRLTRSLTFGVLIITASTAISVIHFQRLQENIWPAPLDRGNWRVVLVDSECDNCQNALKWLIPSVNKSPKNWAFATKNKPTNWLTALGLSAQIPIATMPNLRLPTPHGLIIHDGELISTFEISEQEPEEEP